MYGYEINEDDYLISMRILRKQLKGKVDLYVTRRGEAIKEGRELKY